MRIVNITPGLLPIPPNGWGAIEKIIWEIHQNLISLGHYAKILYTDEVNQGDFDIVHVHVANLANLLYERGIPYIFTFHDHHAFLYGKDSSSFKENYLAIKNSLVTLVPAKFLVDYFDHPKVKYFSHGVNNEIFIKSDLNTDHYINHRLLCIANNGWAGDPGADRKGFSFAIEAAKKLGMSITIAGPSNNKKYFEENPPEYEDLTIMYDLKALINSAEILINTDFSEAPSIFFDANYLESILLNLMSNSIKFASSERKLQINLKTKIEDDYIILEFSDNGIGMDMERVKDRIFGLYQRFHERSDSKGIGLYLIHSQVTALGGKISVSSKVNEGTTFYIKFKQTLGKTE